MKAAKKDLKIRSLKYLNNQIQLKLSTGNGKKIISEIRKGIDIR
jgi:hypothetical protein